MRGEEAVRKKGFYELGSFPVLQQQSPEGMREEEWGFQRGFVEDSNAHKISRWSVEPPPGWGGGWVGLGGVRGRCQTILVNQYVKYRSFIVSL